jgi:hypothetical protein
MQCRKLASLLPKPNLRLKLLIGFDDPGLIAPSSSMMDRPKDDKGDKQNDEYAGENKEQHRPSYLLVANGLLEPV